MDPMDHWKIANQMAHCSESNPIPNFPPEAIAALGYTPPRKTKVSQTDIIGASPGKKRAVRNLQVSFNVFPPTPVSSNE